MGTSTDEIRRELDATREDLDEKLDVLQGRARRVANTAQPILAIVAGAAVAVLAGGYLVYRSRRRPAVGERLAALVPERLLRARDATELRLRRGVPPTQIYIGGRRLGEEPPASSWQKIGLRLAQSAGTAAGSAVVAYALRTVTKPDRAA